LFDPPAAGGKCGDLDEKWTKKLIKGPDSSVRAWVAVNRFLMWCESSVHAAALRQCCRGVVFCSVSLQFFFLDGFQLLGCPPSERMAAKWHQLQE